MSRSHCAARPSRISHLAFPRSRLSFPTSPLSFPTSPLSFPKLAKRFGNASSPRDSVSLPVNDNGRAPETLNRRSRNGVSSGTRVPNEISLQRPQDLHERTQRHRPRRPPREARAAGEAGVVSVMSRSHCAARPSRISRLSFPKLAKRFGNASSPRDSVSLPVNDNGRAPETLNRRSRNGVSSGTRVPKALR
jgi:hypothetical protein